MEQTQIPFGMLLQKAVKIRTHILEMLAEAKSGHPGGSLSAVEILVSLYFYKMRHDPKRPDWPDRDRFVLSKGHAAPVLFATLAEAGYIPISELKTLRKLNSRLQGHFFFSSRRRHTRSVSAFLLNRSSDLEPYR